MTQRSIQRRRDPRAAVASFLSFLLPGLGQAYNRQWMLATLLLAPVLLLVALGLTIMLTGGSGVLASLLDVRLLVALIILDASLLAWRVVSVLQAHDRRERFSVRRWTTYATSLLVVLVVVMHAIPGWYAVKAIDTINSISLGGTGVHGGPAGLPEFSALPEPTEKPDVRRGERVNILLVGVDSGFGRQHALTDTMLVVSLDTGSGRSAMVSIPRDLYGVPLPDGSTYDAKLNSLMVIANLHPDQYPAGGVGTLKAAVGELLGVRIHYFAAVNLEGFQQAIDAVGGVDVTLSRPLIDPAIRLQLAAGTHHMDGKLALAYVRARKGVGENDFTRADRQQLLLAALRQKLTAGNLVTSLPALLDAVKNSLATDLPGDQLPQLAQAVQEADMSKMERVVLQPPEYMSVDAHSAAGYILIPDLDAIRALGERLLGDAQAARP